MAGGLKDIGPVVLVGAGKMGLALARGWLSAGLNPAEVSNIDKAQANVEDFAAELLRLLAPSAAQASEKVA